LPSSLFPISNTNLFNIFQRTFPKSLILFLKLNAWNITSEISISQFRTRHQHNLYICTACQRNDVYFSKYFNMLSICWSIFPNFSSKQILLLNKFLLKIRFLQQIVLIYAELYIFFWFIVPQILYFCHF
jgi:hypothetical protein